MLEAERIASKISWFVGSLYIVCVVLVLFPLLVVIVDPTIPIISRHLVILISWVPLGCGIYCAFKDTSFKYRRYRRFRRDGTAETGADGFGFFSGLLILAIAFVPIRSRIYPHLPLVPYVWDVVSITCWASSALLAISSALVLFLFEEPGKADAAS